MLLEEKSRGCLMKVNWSPNFRTLDGIIVLDDLFFMSVQTLKENDQAVQDALAEIYSLISEN